ncbi:hypothetical protein MMC08_007636, partial [Hypocenomyce scalaris]|nr:hypothetical protein [Hypocenomyce scalaris]
KDVKVFPWKILAHALKKIIGKYSASYSSTAGALLTPVSSTYGAGVQADIDHRPTASSRSASVSTASTAYAASLTSTAMSPHLSQRSLSAYQSSGPPLLPVSLPVMAPAYTAPALHYTYHPQQEQMTASSGQMQQAGRGASWDFSSFLDPNAAPAPSSASNAHALRYQRNAPTPEGTPSHYQMMRHPTSGS